MTSARGTLRDSLEHADRLEQQPPLYFLLLNLWLRLHRSIGVARLLSLPAAVFGVLLTARTFVRVSREESRSTIPIILMILLGCPLTMYLATEARSYALQFAGGALLASSMAAIHARKSATATDVASLLAAGVFLSYLNYIAGFAAVWVTVVLLLTRSLTGRQVAVIAGCGLVLVSPLLWTVQRHVQTHQDLQEHGGTFDGVLRVFYWLPRMAIPYAIARGPWQSILGGAVAVAVAAGLVYRHRTGQKTLPSPPFLAAAGLTIALFLAVGLLTGTVLVQERYFSAFLPFLWIATWLLLRFSLGWIPTVALLLVLAAGGCHRIAALHGPGIRRGDWRRIAARINQDPPQPIFVFPPQEALVLGVELGDPARVNAFPKDYDGSRFVQASDYVVDNSEGLRTRVAQRTGGGRFWMAYTTPPIAPPEIRQPMDIVRTFIEQRCTVEGEFPFNGSRLLQLRLKPDGH